MIKQEGKMKDCVFCQIASGKIPSYKIYEDDDHLAFLGIYPNTEGMTVVVPKKHFSSYAFDAEDKVLCDLIKTAKKVGKLLDRKLDDVGRTALVLEGFGIDHLHAKLFPMHGTKMDSWQPIHSKVDKYFDKYEGYISSHDSKRASDDDLEKLVKKIKS